MKILINACYGGFNLKKEILDKFGFKSYDCDELKIRTNPELIALYEAGVELSDKSYTEIVAITIPDEATDFKIDEYDGFETVIYVLNGKIHYAEYECEDEEWEDED